ncbi:hypothetical protein [Hymenobacter crusticola]|nr:hypothetical protein [Hymenobacter crusticola]
MKKLILPMAFALLLQMTSCITTEREVGTGKASQKTYNPTAGNRITSRSVLSKVNAQHYFTSTKAKDQFVLVLQGSKIVSAQASLVILTSTGDTIRKEVIPATALLKASDLDDPQAATVRDKEIAILKAMNNFFHEDHFTQPAIPRAAVPPTNVDTKAWSAVHADTKAVGFDYIAAGGKERRIAYAKTLQKAVIIAD